MPEAFLVYGTAAIPAFGRITRNSAKYCLFLGRHQAGGEEIVRCGDAI
jgi:hypothetical protein